MGEGGGGVTVLLGPIGIKEYDQSKAEQREEITKELFKELAKCSNAFIPLFYRFFFLTQWQCSYRFDLCVWGDFWHGEKSKRFQAPDGKCVCKKGLRRSRRGSG